MTRVRGTVAFPTIDTRSIREWAAGLRAGHGQLGRGVDTVEQVRSAVDGVWDGAASDRFGSTMTQRRTDVARIAGVARDAAPVLDEYVAAVERATTAYERAAVAEQQARRIGIEAAPAFFDALSEQGAAALSVEAAGAACAAALTALQLQFATADTLDDVGDATSDWFDSIDSWPFPETERVEGTLDSLTPPILDGALPARSSEWGFEGDLGIPLAGAFGVSVGGDIKAQITELRDGTTKVELTLSGRLAATAGRRAAGAEGQLGAEGESVRELTFASRAEADRFLADLRDSVLPTSEEVLRAGGSPILVGADAAGDAQAVLDHYKDRVTGSRTTQRAYVRGLLDVEAGPAGLGVDARLALSETIDTKAGTTAYGFELDGALDVDGGVAQGDGETQIRSSIETRDGRATRLVITSDSRVLGGADALAARGISVDAAQVNVQTGIREQITVSVNLNDPANAALAREFLGEAATHDPVGIARSIGRLQDAGQVVVQYSGAGRAEGAVSLPARIVEARMGTDVSQVIATQIKEPYGTLQTRPPGR